MDIIPRMDSRSLLTALIATMVLAGCTLFRSPPPPPGPPGAPSGGETPAGTAHPAQPSPPAPPAPPEAPGPPPAVPPRQFHLGSATSALVTQAHQQAATGDTAQAAATLERALRIEPGNPLVRIELGRVRLADNSPAQAEAMGREALARATGTRAAPAGAWRPSARDLRPRR